jgi:hypothetical protein
MSIARRTTPLWGVVILALAVMFLARSLDLIPAGIFDLIVRSWPGLLVLLGLWLLLRDRVPYGGLIALLASAGLIGVVAVAAFTGRAAEQRDDTRQLIEQALPVNTTLLRVRVETLATDVELLRSLDTSALVVGEFVGSSENSIALEVEEPGDGSVTLALREVQASPFPMLEAVGRGTLRLELPPNIPLDIAFAGSDGSATLNVNGLDLERLNVTVGRGDVVVTMPAYQPRLSPVGGLNGTIATNGGDVTIFIPAEVAARLELNRFGSGIEPQYDANIYNYLVGDVLEARSIEIADIVVRYAVTAPRGRIRVEVP